MASTRAIAIRKQNAIERLRTITEQMALRAGIDPPAVGKRASDPDLSRVQDLEAVADFLESYAQQDSPQKAKKEGRTRGNKEE